jgi:sugar phosphate isomerase/epimerase
VELTPGFAGLPFHNPADFQPARCRVATQPFVDSGIHVAAVNGSTNLLDPDLGRRHRGLARLHALICHCHDFGTRFLVTETGSLSPLSPCLPSPENRTPQAREELLAILGEACDLAQAHDVTLLLKADPHHVLAALEDALWLQQRLPSPALGFVLDPAAFLTICSPNSWLENLAALCRRLAPVAPLVHAKDLRREGERVVTPGVGCGLLDYREFFRLLAELRCESPVIVEHVQVHTLAQALAYLRHCLS